MDREEGYGECPPPPCFENEEADGVWGVGSGKSGEVAGGVGEGEEGVGDWAGGEDEDYVRASSPAHPHLRS